MAYKSLLLNGYSTTWGYGRNFRTEYCGVRARCHYSYLLGFNSHGFDKIIVWSPITYLLLFWFKKSDFPALVYNLEIYGCICLKSKIYRIGHYLRPDLIRKSFRV
ncbi:hypothetical protein SAMN05444266_103392 [Chitinophaga jiangningensis]|uniref:Uncharacterized protein n=1 Tax=Chitinophaga jiangningensis TaxID=1419482 RepID=A0A1M7AS49_9BACT|nr:hypothetical protein SAMN05444266_103392 [Chitinophaga jiangningensis]